MKEWITGRNPVYEVLRTIRRQVFRLWIVRRVQQQGRINDILSLSKREKVPVEWVERKQLDKIADNHQGVALQVDGYPYAAFQDVLQRAQERNEPLFVLLLDLIQDPQNFGTLLRTAEAVGVHGVVMPGRRAARITPAVVNASSGACEHLLVLQANISQTISALKKEGVWIIGLEGSSDAQSIEKMDLSGPLGVVVGSEGEGMRELVRRSCDVLVQLPMRGKIESLNAAVAGSVVLYSAYLARYQSVEESRNL
ncbi:MAG TPA: 23S rRNA (guanosine(2251)-2'-O)-methyltransferase RlmB [Anaerolineae bacterium]|nr:23S rRNA (guanosine(2251)-2'-O)-methyltransferase RlmB [Anaerolineae bacterium]